MENTKNTSSKRDKIIYWVATIWLSFGMVFSGVMQIMQIQEEKDLMAHLGYPNYFMVILGVWKLLGSVAVLAPRYPIVKEWAYAGFFVSMSGAFISHLAVNDPITDSIGPMLLVVLTVVSWFFRPADRRIG